jgi:hypothetical protein
MGNSASGLPYDEAPSEPVVCPGTYWSLRDGFKKQVKLFETIFIGTTSIESLCIVLG